ncbi:MAG: Secretion system C-terminal sorting domain [Bacteroidota bacterium]|jgi:hypothetical protein
MKTRLSQIFTRIIFTCLIACGCIFASAVRSYASISLFGNGDQNEIQKTTDQKWESSTAFQVALPIDSLDTVYLDMSQAQYIGNQVLIPAFFNANDQVFAFDFAFRYDHTRLEYDTILTTAAGATLLTNSYLNPNDSIVRFTSSQFSAIPNAQPIALVRFNLIGASALDTTDLFNLVGYLNGDPCSERIIPPGITSLSELVLADFVKVFPNPVSDELKVQVKVKAQLGIFDIKGNRLADVFDMQSGQELSIATQSWPAGRYMLVFSSGSQRWTYSLVVTH